ncbi:hypothetical protein, partial [Streptomyces turgidiscabies]|uniref:hypothetical protein n=1 Tax=Streptomyces turgidiscabies TaxID=85558 RepID=UPI0038F77C3E
TTIVNLTKKVYFQSDYKNCLRLITSARSVFNPFAETGTFKLDSRNEIIAGLPTDEWISSSIKDGKKRAAKCWTLKSKEIDPHCAELVSTYCGIP